MSDVANVTMAEVWDGEEGDEWTEHAARYDATDELIWSRFEAHVSIAPEDRVLDIGCGTGKSTRATARRAPNGHVLGVDLSSRMLAYARERAAAEGLGNVEFLRADAQVHPFERETFDRAISAFGAMFFDDPVAAFANIARSLRPKGELALLSWQPFEDNEWLTSVAAAVAPETALPRPPVSVPGPFGLADPAFVRTTLSAAGYTDVELISVTEPIVVGSDVDDANEFVSQTGIVRGLTEPLDDDERSRALGRLRELIAAHDTGHGVLFGSAAWLITATRRG